mmetsp:Transcript_9636/g.9431  ORF Transcript_9636/g.9431 Transcript_9636/m.9431 type:complete len:123 (+) Transcript_9636:410-778(+)
MIMLALFIGFGVLTYTILVRFNKMIKEFIKDTETSGEEDQNSPKKPDILEQQNIMIPLIFLPFFAGFTATFSNTVAKLNMNVFHDDILNHQDGDPRLGWPETISLVLFNIFLIWSNLFLLSK